MDIKKYMEDYYKLRITNKAIQEDLEISSTKFYSLMKENNLKTIRKVYDKLDLGIKELNTGLTNRYSDIVKRCNNYDSYQYKDKKYNGMEYLYLQEWVNLCMENKEIILNIWNRYIDSGKDRRLALSVDRIDDNKSYTKDNIQFITNGLNGYKRNVNPIKVTHNNKDYYFMTCKEASRYFDIRENTIGDILRGEYRLASKDYSVEESDIETVLDKNNIDTLNDYYEKAYIS